MGIFAVEVGVWRVTWGHMGSCLGADGHTDLRILPSKLLKYFTNLVTPNQNVFEGIVSLVM